MADPEQDLLLALAVSPDFQKDRLILAGRHSGLYQSHDEGRSWGSCSIVAGQSLSVTALAFSPNFLRDHTIFVALPGGVAFSHDAGNSWLWTQLPTPPPYVSALAVSPNFAMDNTLFAATLEDGVFRSIDGGVSWQAWNFGLLDKQVLCLAISLDYTDDGKIYAGTGTGLFCSPNAGRSWRELNLPVDDSVLSLALSRKQILAGTEGHGLFTSVDNGESWKQINARGLEGPINAIEIQAGRDAATRVLAGNRLMESADGARTWQNIMVPPIDEPIVLAASLVGFSAGQVTRC